VSSEFSSSAFEKGVVVAIYSGPDSLPEILTQLGNAKLSMPPERIPRNSVVVRRISRGADKAGNSSALCFPFFSSHMSMPVKPAEVVWIIFDRDSNSTGYWITRVHGDETSEDVNYSHYDRTFSDVKIEKTTSSKAGVATPTTATDDFPNISLRQTPGNNDYDLILSGATHSYPNSALEPVPRYIKSPGDLVLQGSNNATIALTVDRGWSTAEDPAASLTSISSQTPFQFTGTVDIVAGRARWLSIGESKRTTPPVRTNRRSFTEVAKKISDFPNALPAEGDPDFLDDAARVYVSTSTNVDYNFGLTDLTPSMFDGGKPPDETLGSSITTKADEIRIIARTDVDHQISGSIRIIKEGKKDDDLSAIIMHPDGLVQISGRQIHIGRSSADGGLEEGDSDAPGTSQPYVKYKQLEDLLKAIIADVKSFCDTMNTHTTPGYGAPSVQINQAVSSLKSAMETRESEIPQIRSTRIFGE
jgi:hypothetical protein